jgi:hypothetical protein
MRFHLGKPPEALELKNDQQTWNALELPQALVLQFFALPVGVLIAYGLLLGWSWTPFDELTYSVHGFADVASVLLAVISFLVIHEVLHCLAHPGFGGSRQSVIGVDVTALLPYAAYLGEMSRGRTLLVLLTPLLVLSVLPLLVCLVGGLDGSWLAIVSILNGFGSGGDLVIVALVLLKVPRGVLMRDSDWKMWWRATAPFGGEHPA